MQENELVGTYDGAEVTGVLGALPLYGLSDGDAITAQRSGALYTKRVGIKGSVARARSADKSGTIEIRLLATSAANDAISAMVNLDSLTVDGKAVFPITVADLSGRTVISAGQAWLESMGPVTFGGEVGERVYTFACADLKMVIGGNNV